jgi:putative cell wall-binding protein
MEFTRGAMRAYARTRRTGETMKRVSRIAIAVAVVALLASMVGASSAPATDVQAIATAQGTATVQGSGDPIEGATVDLWENPGGPGSVKVATTKTSATGSWALGYAFNDADTYQLSCWKTGFVSEWSSVFPGTVGTPYTWNTTHLSYRGIHGRISKSGGDDLPGARVELYEYDSGKLDYQMYSTADSVGDYTFPDSRDTGNYYVKVEKPGYVTKWSGPIAYVKGTESPHNVQLGTDPDPVERVASADRFTTAVDIAREGFTDQGGPVTWPDVAHVVIASGEDRAAADPLAAAGLCGWHDAPLFLVSSTKVSTQVKQAIKEIAQDNGTVTVHIVGGPVSVPDARYAEIESYVGGAGTLVKDRILATGDRYDLAAAIAGRVMGGSPGRALIANGADPDKFFDALALSPVSAYMHYPILLVAQDEVPSATAKALNDLGKPMLVVAGGTATVSEDVYEDLLLMTKPGIERWWGPDRYKTAIEIADEAAEDYWLGKDQVGIAAKLPDALTGGSVMGRKWGPLLITQGDTLTSSTGNWLAANKGEIAKCYVFGGEVSVTPAVRSAIEAKLQ